MSDYERVQDMSATADAVFAFVSNPQNFPHYLPTVHQVEPAGEGRLRLHGDAHGHKYTVDGNFKADAALREMEWDAEEPKGYSGSLTVKPGDVETSFCEVTLTLSYENAAPSDTPSDRDENILRGIAETLKRIQQHVEK